MQLHEYVAMYMLLVFIIKSILFFPDEAHIEFCCHLARGNIDPKETPVYEYVKFIGDFKFHNNGKDICRLKFVI